LTDDFVDIISRGYDLAIRIGELDNSSLIQRKLAADRRVIVASPKYLEVSGLPTSLTDLDYHNCLSAGAQDVWRVTGPDGEHQVRVKGNIRSNSAEFTREALMAGLGIGFRSLWDVRQEIERGDLKVLLPQYRGSDSVAIYAVYPCRDFMPAKVNEFIDYLAGIYGGNEPYWERGLDLDRLLGVKTSGKPVVTDSKSVRVAQAMNATR
jgi:DNA-binding transcriptional LysR family regulator